MLLYLFCSFLPYGFLPFYATVIQSSGDDTVVVSFKIVRDLAVTSVRRSAEGSPHKWHSIKCLSRLSPTFSICIHTIMATSAVSVSAASVPVPTNTASPVILPATGTARVKSVLSGDTVILLGKAPNPQAPPPEVLFTFESLSAPR